MNIKQFSKYSAVGVIVPCTLFFQSCCTPNFNTASAYPQSVTETHTKTTLVMPPSYATVAVSPPSLMQNPPVVQQPVMMASQPCQSYASSPCPPSYTVPAANSQSCIQTASNDPCSPNYTISVPPVQAPVYRIQIPPASPPQYQIQVPSQPAPQYNLQAAPLKSDHCEQPLQSHNPC